MESLNKIFSIKKVFPVKSEEPQHHDETDEVQVRMTYYQTGYGASKIALGQPLTFKSGLQDVYSSFEDQCRKLKEEQEKLK